MADVDVGDLEVERMAVVQAAQELLVALSARPIDQEDVRRGITFFTIKLASASKALGPSLRRRTMSMEGHASFDPHTLGTAFLQAYQIRRQLKDDETLNDEMASQLAANLQTIASS